VRDLVLQHRGAVCRIVCPDIGQTGTGFFIEDDIVITCDHVVSHEVLGSNGLIEHEYSVDIRVETTQGASAAMVVNEVNSTAPYFHDYAILRTTVKNPSTMTLGNYTSVQPGDSLLVLGFPLSSDHVLATRGMVAAKARISSHRNQVISLDVVEIDGSINPGQSGGPALLEDGEVAGIISVRYGSIAESIRTYRASLGVNAPSLLSDLLSILEETNQFLNPGLGFAVSTEYVLAELASLRKGGVI
jgi:S1-C subfamily serine protease